MVNFEKPALGSSVASLSPLVTFTTAKRSRAVIFTHRHTWIFALRYPIGGSPGSLNYNSNPSLPDILLKRSRSINLMAIATSL